MIRLVQLLTILATVILASGGSLAAADEPDTLALESSRSRLDNAYGLLVRGLNEETRSRLEAAQKA